MQNNLEYKKTKTRRALVTSEGRAAQKLDPELLTHPEKLLSATSKDDTLSPSKTEDPIYRFIQNNKGMVYDVAKIELGTFNPDEIMNEAYFAARLCIMGKRNCLKKSHGQTVFYWYLRKQFSKLRNTVGVFDERGSAPQPDTEFHEDSAIDCSDALQGFTPDEYHDDQPEGDPGEHTLKSKFYVHTPSLHTMLPSRALEALSLLSQGCDNGARWKHKLTRLKAFYHCSSPFQLRKKIFMDVNEAVQKSGSYLYRVSCKNGANNTILLAARSAEEAKSIIPKKFGKLIQIVPYADNCE